MFLSEGVYRQSYQDAINSKKAPAIPVQPISYGDAIYFMRYLHACRQTNRQTPTVPSFLSQSADSAPSPSRLAGTAGEPPHLLHRSGGEQLQVSWVATHCYTIFATFYAHACMTHTYASTRIHKRSSTYIEVNNIQEERLIYDITATIYGTVDPGK